MKPSDAAEIIKKVGEKRLRLSLRRWREQVQLNQKELASLAGVAQQTVSFIETGDRKLTPRIFAQLMTVIDKAYDKKQAEEVRAANEGLSLGSIFPPEKFGQITSLASLESPETFFAMRGQETVERVKDKLIQEQGELIRILKKEITIRGQHEAKQGAQIANLESRVEELRDLLGLETDATVSRAKADELRESLTVAGMRKENAEEKE